MVTALIKLVQDTNVGDDGCALVGDLADDVVISNVNNTDIGSWEVQILEVPYGSAVSKGILADANGSTPLASFAPDVAGGCWRLQLRVWPQINRGGTADTDIRNFGVPGANGLIAPPPMIWPEPLPDPRSGRPGAKPNEMNFGGDADSGWAGDGSDGLLRHAIRLIGAGGSGVSGIPLTYSASTADSDPGPGGVRLSNATPSAAVAMYVDDLEAEDGTNIRDLLADLGTYVGSLVTLRSKSASENWITYRVGGYIGASGYSKLTDLTVVDSSAAVTFSVTAADTVLSIDVGLPMDLENKSLVNAETITYGSALPNDGNCGAAKTIDFSAGQARRATLNAATCAITLTPPPGVGGVQLDLYQDTGGQLATFAVSTGSLVWIGGSPPTLTTTPGAADRIVGFWDGATLFLQAPGEFGPTPLRAGAFISESGYLRLGLPAGSGALVASAADTGLLRMPRGNNVLVAVRDEGDADDLEGIRWNSPSSALTFGESGITQTRMIAGTQCAWIIGATAVFYATSTRLESVLSFLFKDTVASGRFGQVARTGATAGSRVTYSGQDTVNGAAGAARLEGGAASGSGAGGNVELIPGASGSSTAGNIVEGVVPSGYNGMQFGKFVGAAIAAPTAKPITNGRFEYNLQSVGWITWSSGGLVASLAPGAAAALVNSKTTALVGVTGAAGKATTNATPATQAILDLSAPVFCGALDDVGVTVTLNAEVTVRGGTDTASIRIRRKFKRMSGGITAGAAAAVLFTDIDAGIAGTVALDLVFSGNVIQAQVTGKAATNLDWVLSWSIDSTGV